MRGEEWRHGHPADELEAAEGRTVTADAGEAPRSELHTGRTTPRTPEGDRGNEIHRGPRPSRGRGDERTVLRSSGGRQRRRLSPLSLASLCACVCELGVSVCVCTCLRAWALLCCRVQLATAGHRYVVRLSLAQRTSDTHCCARYCPPLTRWTRALLLRGDEPYDRTGSGRRRCRCDDKERMAGRGCAVSGAGSGCAFRLVQQY